MKTRNSMNWQRLSSTSHYRTAVAVQHEMREGHMDEAATGIEELIDALARSEKRALKSQLVRLMLHVLKWKEQPEQRTRSWSATIADAREEIAEIQEETPSLNRTVIKQMWDKCFQAAKRAAEGEIDQKISARAVSWKDVFETAYEIE